jgi:hypothetical protein
MGFASLASFAWASSALAGVLSPAGVHHVGVKPNDGVSGSKAAVSSSTDAQPELLLMDVMYDQLRVDSALSVLQDKQGRLYVPVRQFASTLGFRLHVDPSRKTISGFLNSPSERLELDGVKGTYRQKRSTTKFDPALSFARDGDLYLDADVFARIAGLHLLWQMNLLQLEVSSASPLNVEKQWIQRARQDVEQMTAVAQQNYRSVPVPYKLWSVPSVDAQVYTAGAMADSAGGNGTSVSVTGAGDLLMMSAQYRVMSDSNGQPTALLSLGRNDPGGDLLGSLHATQFSFGDLYLPPEPLLARGRNAMGLTISNDPLPGQTIKEIGQLRGHGVPGAQLELYEHDQLLGTTTCDSSGNYHFYGLNLDRGPNDLQVVSVTPDGDVHQETRKVYSGNDGPALNESRYEFTAGKVGNSVFGADAFGTVQNQDSTEVIADYQRGLGNGAWASAVSALTNGQQGWDKELGLGLHSWFGPMLWNAQSMVSLDGGTAFSTGVTRRIGNMNATLERTEASGTMAARILPEIGANGTSLTSLDLEGTSGKHGYSSAYGFDLDRLEGTSPATVVRARLSEGTQNLMISNTMTLRLTQAPSEMSGYTEIRKPLLGSVGLLDFGYEVGGGPPLQLARLTLNRNINSIYSARVGFEYDATRDQPIGALATLYHSFGPIDLGLNIEVLQRGSVVASLLFSTGLQGEGAQGHMALARPGVGESGTVVVRAFVDKHLSGRYEPDDPLLPDVAFLIDGHPRSVSTGKDGRATIDRLAPNQRVSISADEESFENPSWVSENPGVTTVPRPGRAIAIDFPVLETAELEGKLIEPKGVSPPPGLSAELVDSKQQIADTSILDATGTYVFSRVRPGTYHIRLIDLAGKIVNDRSVTVAPGAIMNSVDIDGSKSITSPVRS